MKVSLVLEAGDEEMCSSRRGGADEEEVIVLKEIAFGVQYLITKFYQ